MKLNLSPAAVAAVHELQEDSTLLSGMLEDAENYILDNIDTLTGDEQQSFQAISHVKSLRSVRKLLLQINQEEGDQS
jgi:hypothetical protein